jgi:hypothetical protein
VTLVSTHDLLAGEIFWRHRKVQSRAFLLFSVTASVAVDVGVAVAAVQTRRHLFSNAATIATVGVAVAVAVVIDRLQLRG